MIPTSFGDCRIFDAHTHFFPRSFFAGLGRQTGLGDNAGDAIAEQLGWDAPLDPEKLAARWVGEMDRHGVDRMVSIHTLPGDLESAGAGVAASEGRLTGYAMVNPLAAGAVKDIERAVRDFGFRGVALFPAMFGFSPTSDPAYAVFDAADRLGLNVFVHCGVLKVGFRKKLGLRSAFDGTFSNPLVLQRPCAEFQKARFIIPHLGSGMLRELLMLADMASNVYTDTSGVAGWAKYLDGAPTPAQVIRQAVNVMSAERLLFGTDSTFFPRGWRRDIFEQQLRHFQEAQLASDEVKMILGGNLDRLLSRPV